MTTTVERLQIEMDMKAQGVSSDLIALIRLVQSMEREAKKAAAGPKAVEKALKDMVRPVQTIAQEMNTLRKSVHGVGQAFRDVRAISQPFVATAKAITGVTQGLVKEMAVLEKSFVSVTKTVDETTTKSYAEIRREIKALAGDVPIATEELFRLGGAAGQLGVSADDVSRFVETAAKLGIATDLTAEKAAISLAKLSAIMGTTHEQATAFGSVTVALGNNLAATESQIMATALRMSGFGKTVGLTTPEVFAFSAATSALGMSPQLASGAFQRVFLEINSAVKGGTQELSTFASIAGMSSEQFARAWGETPAKAIQQFIAGLNVFIETGGDINTLFDELGLKGTNNIQVMSRAAGGYEQFSKALGIATQEMDIFNAGQEKNSALNKEASKQAETMAGLYERISNEASSLLDDIGESGVGGAIKDLEKYILDNIKAFRDWASSSEDVKKVIKDIQSFIKDTLIPGLEELKIRLGTIWSADTSLEQKLKETFGLLAGAAMEAFLAAVEKGAQKLPGIIAGAMYEGIKQAGAAELNFANFLLNPLSAYGIEGIQEGVKLQGATGGVFEGPRSGYPALMHGRELIVPMNPGQNPYEEMARILGHRLPGFAEGGYTGQTTGSFGGELGGGFAELYAALQAMGHTDSMDSLVQQLLQGGDASFVRDQGAVIELQSAVRSLAEEMERASGISSESRLAMMDALEGVKGPFKDSLDELVGAIPRKESDFDALKGSQEFQDFMAKLPGPEKAEVLRTLTDLQQQGLEQQTQSFDEWLDFASGLGGAKDEFDGWLESMNQARGAIDELPEALLGAVPEPIRAPFGGAQLVGETPAGTQIFRPEQFQAFQQQLSSSMLQQQLEVERMLKDGKFLNFESMDLGGTFKNLPAELVSRITKEWLDKNLNRFVAGNVQGATNQQAMQEIFKHLMDLSMKQQGLGIFDIQKARQEMMLADISKQTDLAGLSDRAYLEKYGMATEVGTEAMNEAANLNRVMSASVAGNIPSLEAMRAGLDLAAIEVEGMRVAGMGLRNSMARLTSQLGGPAAPTDAIPPAGSSGALAASRYSQPLQLVVQMNSRTITDEVIKDFGRRQRTNVGIRG